MADDVQQELFDLRSYTSRKVTPELRALVQIKNKSQKNENVQLELDLFPDLSKANNSALIQAA